MMSFTESISTCLLEKMMTTNGRATRSEYWWYVLFTNFVQPLILVGFSCSISAITSIDNGIFQSLLAVVMVVLSLCQILLLLSSICVAIRRLHDIGLNGWWFALVLIPIGSLILVVLFLKESEKNDNKYGEYPIL